jgi:acyl-CoA ligase (AMP-forming) (exosortase A-associated)
MTELVHELIFEAARRDPRAPALRYAGAQLDYGLLARLVESAAGGLRALGAQRGDRVAVYLPKREEAVGALFGACAAGCAFVVPDPSSTPAQVAAILRDSGALVLVTTGERLAGLATALAHCPALRHAVVCDDPAPHLQGIDVVLWRELLRAGAGRPGHRCIDTDMAALQYTHGGSARPQALVLSHRNLVAAARSMVRCLGITARERLLAVLPLSDEFGLNQLTTAFTAGATAVLHNPLLARDIVDTVVREGITGLAASPAQWCELAALTWPRANTRLRYAACASGSVAPALVKALRGALPRTRIYLLHGQPEAFRATCLAQDEIDAYPGAIGRTIPNAEVLVLRGDGSACEPGEPGELVQRGALVAQGYWNDAVRTRDSFRPLPPRPGLALPETALWTGETVRADANGYLYLVGGGAGMIRTCGHRVRPGEVEEVVYGTGLVEEAAAVGVAHPVLGQVIALLATARRGSGLDSGMLFGACRARLPDYMMPTMVDVRRAPLPRDPQGRIDRERLAGELAPLFAEVAS